MTLTAADLAVITADLAAIVAEHDHSVAFRRNGVVLPAQNVRIASGRNTGRRADSASGQESRGVVTVFGPPDLDVAVEDRFTVEGTVYRIILLRPDRRVDTQAQAELVQ